MRRALSRSISALRASRTNADFSRGPLKACAFAAHYAVFRRRERVE